MIYRKPGQPGGEAANDPLFMPEPEPNSPPPAKTPERSPKKGRRAVVVVAALVVLLAVAAFLALVPAAQSDMVIPQNGVGLQSLCGGENAWLSAGFRARLLAVAVTRGANVADASAYSEQIAALQFAGAEETVAVTLLRDPASGRLAARFADGQTKALFSSYVALLLSGGDYAGVFSSAIPAPLVVNGVEIYPSQYEVTGADLRGRQQTFSGGSAVEYTVAAHSAALPEIQNLPQSASVSLVDATGATAFSGTAQTLGEFTAAENASYTVVVSAALAGGNVSYRFTVDFQFVPVVSLSADSAAQGDVIVVFANNVTEDISCELNFAYTPVFNYAGGAAWALIPISHAEQTGQKTATVRCGEFEQTLEFTVTETAFGEQNLTISDDVSSTTNTQEANEEYAATIHPLYEVYDPEVYWEGTFIQPAEGSITTEYGIFRYTNGSSSYTRHNGIDIANAEGTPIVAPAGAKVLYAGYLQLSGYTIMLEHGMGLHSLFMHMQDLNVETGDIVAQGDLIGWIGTTGYSTGPHLHYQLMIGSYSISPWLAFSGDSGFYAIVSQKNSGEEALPAA